MTQEQGRAKSEQAGADEGLHVEISPAGNSTAGKRSGDDEDLRRSYGDRHDQAKGEHQAKLDSELRGLDKLAEKYERQVREAAKQAGLDLDGMRADFEQAAVGSDPHARQQQFDEVRAKHAAALAKAAGQMKVDRADMRKELADVVGDLPHRHQGKQRGAGGGGSRIAPLVDLSDDGVMGASAWTEPDDVPPPPPPPPSPQTTRTTLSAPYGLRATSGGPKATANAATGDVANNNAVDVGVVQQLAAVGSTFLAEADIRRVRVETTINVSHFFTLVGACLGYASAEAILNLKVLDGSQLLASNRLSLSRTIGVVFWLASNSGSGRYTLSCEFQRGTGTPRNYAVMAEVETWAGGGGALVVSPATAWCYAKVEGINAILMR